jgi:hypothetical protein
MNEIPLALRAKFDAVLTQMVPSMARAFWGRDGKRPVSLGSGIFVTLGGMPGLITAGHVLDGDGCGPGDLLIAGPLSPLIRPSQKPLRSVVNQDGTDGIDVAVFRLHPKDVGGLGVFESIAIDDVQAPEPYRPGRRFAVVGFPVSKNSKPVPDGEPLRGNIFVFGARERAPTADMPRSWIRPETHLLLNWDHKRAFDSARGWQTPMSLSGVSGGVVVDLGETLDPAIRPRLVGIFTHHLKTEKLLVATRLYPIVHGASS